MGEPYYHDEDSGITIYHGDCREILPTLTAAVMVTDPPFGIDHSSNKAGAPRRGKAIEGDASTVVRDHVLKIWGNRPSVVFGSIKSTAVTNARGVLIWDKGGHVGQGDLSFPWKQNWEFIYISGEGFSGRRGTGVLSFNAIAPWAGLLTHPHEKPVDLMRELIHKSPPGHIIDPFMGSGTTLLAAKLEGRQATGIELEERYCEIAANRLRQKVLQWN